jgi:hypothetical protein
VVYDRDGQAFGDPDPIRLGAVPKLETPPPGFWNRISLAAGVMGLLIAAAALREAGYVR